MKYNDFISGLLRDKEISMFGFADLGETDCDQRQGLPYGICIAIPLTVFPNVGEPTAEYYNEYRQINSRLKEACLYLEENISQKGFRAYSLFRNRQNEDFRTLLPFKTLATRSGLGWIGKSSVLVTKEYGSAVRLGGVITDMPFDTASPINESQCGNCRACVDSCPAGAIVGNHWNIALDRDGLVDPFKCKEKVMERGKAMGVSVGSCGICLSVCPWTIKYVERRKREL